MNNGGWGTARFKATTTCHPEAKHYARGLCKACYRNLPDFKAKRRLYYESNTQQWKHHNERVRRLRLREARRYGISGAAQELLLEKQGHVCAICQRPAGHKRLGVDHDHETGRVRGMLCGLCNTALGSLRDDPELCERAARYLRDATVPATTAAV